MRFSRELEDNILVAISLPADSIAVAINGEISL